MTEYSLIELVEGSWKIAGKFEYLDDAKAHYKMVINDPEFDGRLVGVLVEPHRKPAYMIERSDWE